MRLKLHKLDTVEVKSGQKYAIRDIKAGEKIIKYGFSIGVSTSDIKAGETVGPHNLVTALSGVGEWKFTPYISPLKENSRGGTFKGYLRKSGDVGIRNELYIIPTVGCINSTVKSLASIFDEKYGIKVRALCHPYGCSQLGGDLLTTQKTLAGLIRHPNAGGVLLLGLGCENNGLDKMLPLLDGCDLERVRFLNIQDSYDEISEASAIIEELLSIMKTDVRCDVPISSLKIGVKCGGSDGRSGITANPAVGRVADRFFEHGAQILMTEVPEIFGAEEVLLSKCETSDVFDSASEMIQNFRRYFISHGESIAENPSPGNIAGGITTLEEKSLGCVTKSGAVPLRGALSIGDETPDGAGLYLINGPGNDLVSVTNLAASGTHMILFTTGRGTPLSAPTPTVKISTNTELYEKKTHWIDFDAGKILSSASAESVSDELFRLCLDIANGTAKTVSEDGECDIAIFKDGVTL